MGPTTNEIETQLRAGIRHTRGEMSNTIEALQEKLAPEHIKEQVKEAVQEHANEAYISAKDAVRGKAEEVIRNVACAAQTASAAIQRLPLTKAVQRNPMPFALVGVGLGVAALARRSGPLAVGVAALAAEIILGRRSCQHSHTRQSRTL